MRQLMQHKTVSKEAVASFLEYSSVKKETRSEKGKERKEKSEEKRIGAEGETFHPKPGN